jgi:uncharacterized damage-inducible protein DinB
MAMKKTKRPAAPKAAGKKRKPVMRHGRESVKARSKRAAKPGAARPRAAGLKQRYLDIFAKEFPTTLKVMKAYPTGHDDFKPHERSYSASQLVHSFVQENSLVVQAIRGEIKMPPDFPPVPATYAQAVANYERGARELIAAAEKMPESRLFETVRFFIGPGKMGQVPVSDILWIMLMDSIHHRGQLSVYVRMVGGKVPSIYGPSADEPWM